MTEPGEPAYVAGELIVLRASSRCCRIAHLLRLVTPDVPGGPLWLYVLESGEVVGEGEIRRAGA